MMTVTSVIHVLLQKTNVRETFTDSDWMFPNGKQASYVTNIQKNVGREYTSARLFGIKNVFSSLSDLPGYTPGLLITKWL